MINKLVKKYISAPISFKASVWFIICSFLQKGISLITTPLFTRLMSTEEYGRYTLYSSWLGIISIFVTFKLSEAVFNKSMVAVQKEDRRHVLASYQSLVCVLWIFYICIYLVFRTFINRFVEMSSAMMSFMMLEIFFESVVALWTAYQRFEYKYKTLITVTLLIAVLNPSLGLIAISHMSNHVYGRILGIVVSLFTISIWLFFYNIRYFKKDTVVKDWLYALSFNLPLIPHYLSQILLSQADRIMIGKIIGPSEAALYGVAYTIGMLTTMITQSVNNAYVPWMYRALKDKKYNQILKNNTVLLGFIEIIICCVFIVAPEAIRIMGGEKYQEATYVVYPVACSVFFMFMYGLFANIEFFYEKRKYVMYGTSISAILNIILNAIFIPKFGYIASAYTTLFCYVCYGAFHIVIAKKIICKSENIQLQMPYKHILIFSGSMIIISVIMASLTSYPILRYGILFATLIILFVNKNKIMSFYVELQNEKNK